MVISCVSKQHTPTESSRVNTSMERWAGKVALVTGCAGGIGGAITTTLVKRGFTVVGMDLDEQKSKDLADSLKQEGAPGELHALKVNLRREQEILDAFARIEAEFGGADILVNNAGLASTTKLTEGDTEEWRAVLEVNVLAVSICTREFLNGLYKRQCDQGHVIIINSVAAHTAQYGKGAMYYASKHAVKAMAMCLRRELADRGSSIKVTSVSPGRTRTQLVDSMTSVDDVVLSADDVAAAVETALAASPVTQICEIIITPVPTKFTIY